MLFLCSLARQKWLLGQSVVIIENTPTKMLSVVWFFMTVLAVHAGLKLPADHSVSWSAMP
jgi:hypothetical protein